MFCLSVFREDSSSVFTGSDVFAESVGVAANVVDAKFFTAVKSITDLSYFESKHQHLELACGQWLRILAINWDSFGVGSQVAQCLQEDATGASATEVLIETSGYGTETDSCVFPLSENAVWHYFQWLHTERKRSKLVTLCQHLSWSQSGLQSST